LSQTDIGRRPGFWVETGTSLTLEYFKIREKAIEHAVLRNKFYQRATEAFLRGDGAGARALSQEGRLHDEEMRNLHQQAAEEMFHRRNSLLQSSSTQAIVDLHGLHVEEGCTKLRQKISELRRQMFAGSLFIVVGTGHHTFDHNRKKAAKEGKLGPAVLKLLRELGYSPADASTDQRGGMLAITLRS